MKYYRTPDGQVWAFEDDGPQDEYITENMVVMTDADVAAHLAPPPPAVPAVVTRFQARAALYTVEDYMAKPTTPMLAELG